MRTLFKYADTNVTDKLTTAINKETNVTVRIQKVKSWIDTNLVKKGVTVPKGAIEGNKTATQARAKGFLNHRETLNKLITKLLDGVKSVVPVEKAKEMKALFWSIDKENNNNLTATEPKFYEKVVAILPKDKQAATFETLSKIRETYLSKNPAELKNLQWNWKT
ncbi:hypothetical protein OESDEN_09981 [Oesophagostomum dentatum]|uniref:Uncharacterized protein n=1 Tax=Oesophagostomum dentatum TaxID=61180 RepID=A0A0B1T491_OESDE|nr:hypothetical protein OESDEN_09981 [Oesophagostomum dentatum]